MKRINIFSWLAIMTVALFAGGCDDELTGPIITLDEAAKPTLSISNPAESFTFVQDSADFTFQDFTITPGTTDIPLAWEYVLQADTTEAGTFEKPVNLRTTADLAFSMTVGEMNSALFNAGMAVNEERTIHLRIKGVVKSDAGSSDLEIASSAISMRVTLYEDIVVIMSDLGIIGSATPGGWDSDTDMANPSGDGVNYELNIYLTEGEAKFRKDNDWAVNWGAGDFPSGTGEQDGANIPIPAAADYLVKFNTETGEYSFEAVTRIGIIGSATPGGWDADTDMLNPSGDDENWELVIELTDGEAKFRADNDWAMNWGSDAFPMGTAEQDGANIPVTAGVYTVKFNSTTGEYSFTEGDGGPTTYATIGIIGDATPGGWDADTDMENPSGDGINWELTIELTDGEAKFRADDDWAVSWGSTDFPSGTASMGGDNIPVTAGEYLVKFNTETGEYSFGEPMAYSSIGIIGSATPGGWDADTDMMNPSGDGINYEVILALVDGEAKFRADDDWAVSWGGADFPSGTATSDNGPNIPVTAGTYKVTFNVETGEYNFIEITTVGLIGSATPGGWDADTDMTSTDGINYEIEIDLVAGEAKFRANDDWAINWGSDAFPSGTATQDGANIAVPADGTYTVMFNVVTGEFSFDDGTGGGGETTYATIGIIGSATPGGWDADTDMMNPSGDGINWELIISLADGEAKFRADDDWAVSWGGSDFPAGTATSDNGPNIPVTAGVYKVTFNTTTGEYNFIEITTVGIIGSATAGGWDSDTDLSSTDGVNYEGTVELVAGDAKFRANDDWAINWGSDTFPSGTGTQDGANIPVSEDGTYVVTFNVVTGEYNFEKQ